MHIEFDRRYAFYFDTAGDIYRIGAHRFDRLQRGSHDVALPQMADQRVHFALFHVERFTSQPRIVVSVFPILALDSSGRLDQRRHYDALQVEVDRLEANDYTSLGAADPITAWILDPITHRRLINTLRDLRRPWRSPQLHAPRRAA